MLQWVAFRHVQLFFFFNHLPISGFFTFEPQINFCEVTHTHKNAFAISVKSIHIQGDIHMPFK